MTIIRRPPTGDIVRDLENYLANERELGVWSFPHFVRYLRALIFKLTPRPHRCTLAVLDAAAQVLADGRPSLLNQLITTLPVRQRRTARLSREAANAICEVISYWANRDVTKKAKTRDAEDAYQRAKNAVHKIESAALDVGLTMNDLCECAVAANTDGEIDPNRRDAAVVAMSVGYFKLAHEIATGAPGEKN